MDIKIEGNPGTGNTFQKISQEIHIGTVGTYSNASVINNYYGTVGELSGKKKNQEGAEDDTHDDPKKPIPGNRQREQLKEPEEEINRSRIRAEILDYVSRVRPFVRLDKRDRYMQMWEGILELDAVRPFVYKIGKQKRTSFNRKLIANILHHLDAHHIYKAPYKASDLALALEDDYEMSVRGELGKYPSENVCAEIDDYLETLGL
jgi:hypothetical protein